MTRTGDHPKRNSSGSLDPLPATPSRDPVVEAMRRHLIAARPASGNEALRLLRSAFPHVPLASRVQAAAGSMQTTVS